MQIGSWGNHTFEVNPVLIRSFTGLTIRGGAEVDEKTSNNQKYVRRKAGNAHELTVTVILNAYMGCDVRAEAMSFVEDARNCEEGYFYIAGKKLLPETLMLTEAQVSEVELSPTGEMVHAQVQLTMQQSDKGDAKGSGSATQGKGNKKGTGNTSTKAEQKENAKEFMKGKLKSVEELKKKAWRLSGTAKTTLSAGRTLLSTKAYSDV
uniref:Uncharacterized protein n=1 Tax=Caudovirales sp. ctrNG92 TaxID=2827638 RepID=A0A8S5SF25_9CAUD|nr:MAG TPA: hypothetical protein [Caudovirales sp. ctrNG92]